MNCDTKEYLKNQIINTSNDGELLKRSFDYIKCCFRTTLNAETENSASFISDLEMRNNIADWCQENNILYDHEPFLDIYTFKMKDEAENKEGV